MKYFGNRQNGLTNIEEDEIELAFKSIVDHHGLKWLQSTKFHPLQKLWGRKDILSTNELYSFGAYLRQLAEIDPKWVKEQVRHIKSDHRNNQQGAFFEICALGMLIGNGQTILPAKGNNPGYDGILSIPSGRNMRISLKNYGLSAAHREFNQFSYEFEQRLKKSLQEKGVARIQVVIDAYKKFPNRDEWKALNVKLPDLLDEFKKSSRLFEDTGTWMIMMGELGDDKEKLHPLFNSYTLILSSVYKQNEEKNLYDKLDEACYNLTKHSIEDEHTINCAFIHLPETASIVLCKQWADEYFQQYPDKPLTGIVLYQPIVATDLEKDVSFIDHTFQLSFRDDKFSRWNATGHNLNFTPLVGRVAFIPTTNKLIIEENGNRQIVDLGVRYFYQRGNHYAEQQKHEDGTITGNMSKVGPGIFVHSVLQPFSDQAAMVISAHFPPDDKLLIL